MNPNNNLPLPDGNVVAWSNASTISQTLTGIGLLPNTTYTLSVYIGHRSDDLATTYSVSLQAGSTTLNTISGSNSTIPLGQFAKVTLTYTTGSSVTPGDLSIVLGSGGQQVDFDAISLTTSGGIYYYVEDLLGTSRVMTTATGAVCYDGDFDPYGTEHTYTDTCPQNYKFEGKERDTETGNDDFGARYYTSRFGRWLSADWSSVPVPVPYANLTNPQTLNLYSMVADDPESFADLDGHIQNASQGTQSPGDDSGPTCAATGQGGTGAANSGSCGANQTASQTNNTQAAEDAKKKAQNQTPGCSGSTAGTCTVTEDKKNHTKTITETTSANVYRQNPDGSKTFVGASTTTSTVTVDTQNGQVLGGTSSSSFRDASGKLTGGSKELTPREALNQFGRERIDALQPSFLRKHWAGLGSAGLGVGAGVIAIGCVIAEPCGAGALITGGVLATGSGVLAGVEIRNNP